MRKLAFLIVGVAFFSLSAAARADVSGQLARGLSFCGEEVPLNRNEVYQAVDQNLVLLSEAQSRVWLALKRSGRFLPTVEQALARLHEVAPTPRT